VEVWATHHFKTNSLRSFGYFTTKEPTNRSKEQLICPVKAIRLSPLPIPLSVQDAKLQAVENSEVRKYKRPQRAAASYGIIQMNPNLRVG